MADFSHYLSILSVWVKTNNQAIVPNSGLCKTEVGSDSVRLLFTFSHSGNRLVLRLQREADGDYVYVDDYEGSTIGPDYCYFCDVRFGDRTILRDVGGPGRRGVGVRFKLHDLSLPPDRRAKREVAKPIAPLPIAPLVLERLHPPSNCVLPETSELPEDMVSIIVLSYNTLAVTVNCIRSVLEKTVHPFELFVVDNGSQDGSAEWFKAEPYLTLIANSLNLGYSKANNLAIRRARGEYVCLLNSDTVVLDRGWLGHIVRTAKSDCEIGTVGAKLFYSDGRIQHVGGGIHGCNPYHPYDKFPRNTPIEAANRNVPYNTGACLLITRKALDAVGLLDEDYPFGFEDVDYGLKVIEAGLKNIVCHEALLTHLWAYTQRTTGKGINSYSLSLFHGKWDEKLPHLAEKVTMNWGKPYGKG